MNRIRQLLVGLCVSAIAGTISSRAPAQSGLCPLLDGLVYADDGQFLGRITPDRFANDSVANEFGPYGSPFSSTSMLNEFGTYGSEFSSLSPFNRFTSTPPIIYSQADDPLVYLTVNQTLAPRVTPAELAAWLTSDAPSRCNAQLPTATHTRTRTPVPVSTSTRTPTRTQVRTPTRTHTPRPTRPKGPCYGDCNLDGRLTIAELVTGVNIALGSRNTGACPSIDRNRDGRVAINELIQAVTATLDGCIPL